MSSEHHSYACAGRFVDGCFLLLLIWLLSKNQDEGTFAMAFCLWFRTVADSLYLHFNSDYVLGF
jgi:hypothetical protein